MNRIVQIVYIHRSFYIPYVCHITGVLDLLFHAGVVELAVPRMSLVCVDEYEGHTLIGKLFRYGLKVRR
jgi:hypothetical protein